MLALRSGSTWLHGLASVGELEFSTKWGPGGGGLLVVEWSMALRRGFTHPALRQGALVTLYDGPVSLGTAVMAEPDRDGWRFTADGVFRRAERFAAVDASGATTTDISVAVAEAITRGLPWLDPGDLPTGSLSTDSEDKSNLNHLAPLLDRYCEVNGLFWRIDPHGYLRFDAMPTTPTLALTPGIPALPTADDDYASRIFARYVSAVSGTPPEPSAWGVADAEDAAAPDVQEDVEDITDLGVKTALEAAAITQAMMDAGRSRPAFTRSVEATQSQLTTLGGSPAHQPLVNLAVSPLMVRHHGVLDDTGASSIGSTREWVVGGTTIRTGERTITLTPLGRAPRTSAQVAAKVAADARAVFA